MEFVKWPRFVHVNKMYIHMYHFQIAVQYFLCLSLRTMLIIVRTVAMQEYYVHLHDYNTGKLHRQVMTYIWYGYLK